MKIKLTDYIEKTGEGVSLSTVEREKLLRVTKEYMAMKPIRGMPRTVRSAFSFYVFIRKPVAVALIAVLALSSGVGISYAAEGALPGDLLYPVKVSVNEEVRAIAATTPEKRAEWEAERAEKRLAEASALAVKGRLTEKTEAELVARFEKHADKATAYVGGLNTDSSAIAIDVASGFETGIAAHIEILDEVGENVREKIKTVAREKAQKVATIRVSAEGGFAVAKSVAPEVAMTMSLRTAAPAPVEMDARAVTEDDTKDVARKTAAERLAKSAGKALANAEKSFAKMKSKFSAEELTRVRLAIDAAKAQIDAGYIALQNSDSDIAFHAYQDALVSLKKLNVFLETSLQGKIKLRIESSSSPRTGSTNTSVPPDPTHNPSRGTEGEDRKYPEGAKNSPLPVTETIPPPVRVEVHAEDNGLLEIETESHLRGSGIDAEEGIRIKIEKD